MINPRWQGDGGKGGGAMGCDLSGQMRGGWWCCW
jgi:hypothetical protein